ncbi:ABC transporter substrate-binding protein [Granulicatella seriolae]|uniref:ABC transporter substrate-binding protein n=1 Tax=Granulicatella seriolae TaxID=2967226 RepID=A0ABT1WQ91_9LACT|nr:ABC transporter substrate-binding protein [Granulicatella seriolae]
MNLKKYGLGLVVAALLAGCGANGGAGSSDEVKLGGNFELTGGAAAYGTPMSEGMQLAVDQVNAAGGALKKNVKAIISDNKTDKTETAAVATKLVSEGVVGIIGPATTGDAQAEIPVVERAKIPVIFPAATGNGITLDAAGSVYEYIFRVCFQDEFQGVAAAKFANSKFTAKTAVVLFDNSNDYSQGLKDSFAKTFEGQGGTLVAQESYTAGDTDFQAVLTTLKSKKFDVLYLPGYYEEVGLIIKQAREMGITQPILGGDGYASDTLIELAGTSNLNDIYYTSHFSPESTDKVVQDFVAAYKEKFGKTPDTFAALAYDATNLLVKAIETAGTTDSAKVTEAIAKTTDFTGVTGTFSIDEEHNPVKTAVMIELQDGKVASTENVSGN